MILLAHTLVFLHIAAAAAWFGMALRVTSRAGLSFTLGGSAAATIGSDTRKGLDLMGILLVLAFLFGLVAFFLLGGFARYGAEYHTSLLLIVVLLGIHYVLIRPTWQRFTSAVVSDNTQDASKLRTRLAMFLGIGHLVWIAILFLMLWERYFSGLMPG